MKPKLPILTQLSQFQRIDAYEFLEIFFVSAIASIFLIRSFLVVTGYPQLGGGGLHIAHMLWGGFLLMIALVLMFIFISRQSAYIASIVGGVGFGTFIDELGKFITADNNYFFQPTFALLYIIFILLFFLFDYIGRKRSYSNQTYIINAIDLLKEVYGNNFDKLELGQMQEFLEKADKTDPLVTLLKETVTKEDITKDGKKNIIIQFKSWTNQFYSYLSEQTWFPLFISSLISVFIVSALGSFFYSRFLITSGRIHITTLLLLELISIMSSVGIASVSIILLLAKQKMMAYEWFQAALLVAIFITQIFSFINDQFSATITLLLNLLLLGFIKFVILEAKSNKEF